jgi:hypothetical protein
VALIEQKGWSLLPAIWSIGFGRNKRKKKKISSKLHRFKIQPREVVWKLNLQEIKF